MNTSSGALACLVLVACEQAAAGSPVGGPPTALPTHPDAPAPCVSSAAQYHRVNPWVLKAILKVESNFNPRAIQRNANGTVDIGMGQINSIHFGQLARWGIAPADLMDGCIATYVSAWHLANQLRVHGNTWYGVAAYHSASPCHNARYAGLVWNALTDWKIVSGPRVRILDASSCGYAAAGALSRQRSAAASAAALVLDGQ